MDYPYTKGEDFTDYTKNDTWNLLHAYIDAHTQRLIYEYPGYGSQAMPILKPHCKKRDLF